MIDLLGSRALAFVPLARFVGQFEFLRWFQRALGGRPCGTDARANDQSGCAGCQIRRAPLGQADWRIRVGRRRVVYRGLLKDRDIENDSLLGATNARSANSHGPHVRRLVEHANRAAGVDVRSFAAQLVETPTLTMAVVTELLREAAGAEMRAARALHVDNAIVSELRAQVGVEFRRIASPNTLEHRADEVVGSRRTAGQIDGGHAAQQIGDADRARGIVAG